MRKNLSLTFEKYRKYLPFLFVTLVFITYHCFIDTNSNDDIYFRDVFTKMSLPEILHKRYVEWSSRTLIDLLLYVPIMFPVLWKVADILILSSITMIICSLVEANEKERWYCCFLVLMYPFKDMVSAGWITTTVNCIWPLWGLLFISLYLKKCIKNQKIKWYEYIICAVVLVFTCNQEQVSVVMLTIVVIALVTQLKKKQFKNPFLYMTLVINIASLIFIQTCPGNNARFYVEATNRVPEFFDYTLLQKLCLGLLNVMRVFIAELNPLFWVVAVTLMVLVYKKTHHYLKTMLAALPVLLLAAHSILISMFPVLKEIFVVPIQTFDVKWLGLHTILFLLELFAVIFGVIYAMHQLLDKWRGEFWAMLFILGAGFATAVVMGFSPTLYASANRVFTYFYFSLIFVCGYCVCRNRFRISFQKIEGLLIKTIALIWVLSNVLENLQFLYEVV